MLSFDPGTFWGYNKHGYRNKINFESEPYGDVTNMELEHEQTAIYSRFSGVITHEIEGETVVLMLTSGTYYGLDAVSTAVWRRLEIPCAAQELATCLCSEFGIPRETATADLESFLGELVAEGLLAPAANAGPVLVPGPARSPISTPGHSASYAAPKLERGLLGNNYAAPKLVRGLLRNAAHSPMGSHPDGGHFSGGTCKYS